MADELKIRLTVSGQSELNELIKKFNEGNSTLKEEKGLRKALGKARDETILGTKSEIALSGALVTVKEKIAQSSQNVLTANGKMMQAYFRTGLAVRQLVLSNQGLITSFLGAGSKAEQLASSMFIGLSSAKQLTQGLRMAGIASAAFAGSLAGGLIALPILINLFKKSEEETKKAEERFNAWKKSLESLPLPALLGQLESVNNSIARANGLVAKFTSQSAPLVGVIAKIVFGPSEEQLKRQQDLMERIRDQEIKQTKDAIARYQELAREREKIALDMERDQDFKRRELLKINEKHDIEAAEKSYINEKERGAVIAQIKALYAQERANLEQKIEEENLLAQYEMRKQNLKNLYSLEEMHVQRIAGLGGMTKERAEQLAGPVRVGLISEPILGRVKVPVRDERIGMKTIGEEAKLTFEEAIQHSKAFEHSFSSGIAVVSQGISLQIGGAFTKVFGGAHTLLGQFVGQFTQQLSSILLQLGIRLGLASLGLPVLPFQHGGVLNEPVIGRGLRTGSVYTLAERGPERVTPMRGVEAATGYHGGQSPAPIFVVRNEITASGLATFVEQGNRINRGRRF